MRSFLARLMGRLSVGRKLALIYLLDLSAVIFISAILINEKYIAINFAGKEVLGNQYIGTLRETLLELSASAQAPTGPAPAHAALAASLAEAEQRFGAGMDSAQLAAALIARLQQAPPAQPAAASAAEIESFEAARALLTRIGNQSNLILDPDLDSYYVMSLIVLRFPELLDSLASTGRLARELAATGLAERGQAQTGFIVLEGRTNATVSGMQSDFAEAYSASSPALRAALAPAQAKLQRAIEEFAAASKRMAGLAPERIDTMEYARLESAVFDSLHTAWQSAGLELDRLLRARISAAFKRMWEHLGTAALLLAIILSAVFFVARQIALPLKRLARITADVRRTGDYSLRADWHSRDEIGRLVSGFNVMLEQLDRLRIEQQELVAHASAAQAQRELLDATPIALMVTSIPDHQVLHANQAAGAWLNGRTADPWMRGMDAHARGSFFQRLSDVGTVDEFEVQWKGGAQPSWALVSARRIDYQGQAAVLTTFTPINRLKQLEGGLELWAKVFEASSESIVVMDSAGLIVTVNRAFCRATAYEIHEVIGEHADFFAGENPEHEGHSAAETLRLETSLRGSWQGETWIRRKNGETYPAWLVMNAVRDAQGAVSHFIAISLDISERKANEKRIHYLAHHDVLTGLPNRFLCGDRLQLAIQQARRNKTRAAALFVDLDRFKQINDSLGHHVGDGLLMSVAQRLSAAVREGDTVSRLGGDEFVIILNALESAEEAGKIVEQRLIPAIQRRHVVDGTELYVSCSIGIAVYPDDAADIDTLMRHADSAMYQAKKLGRNNAQFFTPEINERVLKRLHLESDLRHAVERRELLLHYQPRIDGTSGLISGAECLLRWQHPAEGMIAPASFIPVAEEAGLIAGIGAWVLREACRQQQAWRAQGLGLVPLSVNLSALQVRDDKLMPLLEDLARDFVLQPGQLELELTESVLMEDIPATIARLQGMKALGYTISIDDFGTGYSSLNYLGRFPIDKLKIDRSFIAGMENTPQHQAITRAIIGLGHTLGLHVVAEGVERAGEAGLLQNAGCDELQGYHFGRPMPASAFEHWLHESGRSVVVAGVEAGE